MSTSSSTMLTFEDSSEPWESVPRPSTPAAPTCGWPDDPEAVAARIVEITSRREQTQPIRDKTGVTKHATKLGYGTTTLTRRGRGAGSLADVTAGAITEGAAKITSIRNTQTADDFPSYEITAIQKDDL